MIVLGGSNVANNELIGYVAMTLSPSGTTSMNADNITITPTMTVANGVPKVGATASIPAGTLSSNVTKSSGTIDKSDLVETLTVTKNGTQSASDKLWNKVIVNVDTTSGVSIQTSKTATLSTSGDVTVTPDTNYDAMATVVVPKVPLEERSVTLSSSQTLTPSGSNLGFSKVDVTVNTGSIINNQNVTVDVPTTGVSKVVTPDSGYTGLGQVTINALKMQTKSVIPSTSAQTVKADSGYHGLSQVTVSATDAAPSIQDIKSITLSSDFWDIASATSNYYIINPDTGYDSIKQVKIDTNNLYCNVGTATEAENAQVLTGLSYYADRTTDFDHTIAAGVGTMSNNGSGAATLTHTTKSKTLSKGYYTGGAIAIGTNSSAYSVTANGTVNTYDSKGYYYDSITVNVPTSGGSMSNIQSSKTIELPDDFSNGNEYYVIEPDSGYDAVSQVKIWKGNLYRDAGESATEMENSFVMFGVQYALERTEIYPQLIAWGTGTMPNNGAVSGSITTNGGTYTIPKGYHNGSGTVTANIALNAYYVGTTVPEASLGNDGDIYLKT